MGISKNGVPLTCLKLSIPIVGSMYRTPVVLETFKPEKPKVPAQFYDFGGMLGNTAMGGF